MTKSLLFIPDISGFTNFVQTTEAEHSQHVIAELLEVLIDANTLDLQLAEIEGDALFFFIEEMIPSQEQLLAQIETMFTAFYSHLKLLEKNRICPCNACATAPNLQLKIVAHTGELQFLEVQGSRKPFGQEVIEAHRLLKNSVDSDNYILISKELTNIVGLSAYYYSKVFRFREGKDSYDGKEVPYAFSIIDPDKLTLMPYERPKKVVFDREPNISIEKEYPTSGRQLLEYITNYGIRNQWVKGIEIDYKKNEVTRLGSEHVCVINGKHLNFMTVTKPAAPNQLIYGELTTDPPPVDKLYQFFIITPISENRCNLQVELYLEAQSILKQLMILLVAKRNFKKSVNQSLESLKSLTIQG